MRKIAIMLLVLLCAALVTDTVFGMRCGNRLIQKNDHISKVERYCGEPVSYQTSTAYVGRERYNYRYQRYFYEEVPIVIEEMTFNFGPTKFMRFVRLENGIVTRIKTLEYGYRD